MSLRPPLSAGSPPSSPSPLLPTPAALVCTIPCSFSAAPTLISNLTALIVFRIWFTTKKVARFSSQQTLLPVVIVVVESGAIYSISCITLLTVYLLDSNAQYPALDGVSPLPSAYERLLTAFFPLQMFPIISIVFNLIIVRIALGSVLFFLSHLCIPDIFSCLVALHTVVHLACRPPKTHHRASSTEVGHTTAT
jgi:hypothetical protein